MINAINDPRVRRILTLPGADESDWRRDLSRFESGDVALTRKSAGEASIKAVQRLLIFLGYSTSSSGAYAIDGDFGRGTNRAVAQFRFEQGLTPGVARDRLCYACSWQTARQNIVGVPDVRLTVKTLGAMLRAALEAVETNRVACGDFDEALFHLDSLHENRFYSCKQIRDRYGALAVQAGELAGIFPEWILAIIKQETAGVVRPRFEQHWLTRFNATEPDEDLTELRYRSTSFGLGQVMGFNYERVGAPSARAMFNSPIKDQVVFVARYLAPKKTVLARKNPREAEFREIAKFYNGRGYEKHHYHERIETWFREFRALR